MPTYSIIIPVYNAQSYIIDCIDSILSQTFKDFELIIIDDGSTDSSGKICDEYSTKDPRIQVFHQQNEGVSVARNNGIDKARGEWISFIDSDDYISPHYLATFDMIEVKSDLTYFGHTLLTRSGCKTTYQLPSKQYEGWESIQDGILLLKKNETECDFYGYTWNKFFKANIIKQYHIKFIPGVTMKEDELFVDEYINHCNSLALCPDILYNYRWTDTGLTSSYKSSQCLRIYTTAATRFLDCITLPSLRSFHQYYIFHVWLTILYQSKSVYDYRKTLNDIIDFIRKYRNLCDCQSYVHSGLEQMLWNYDTSFKAKLYVLLKKFQKCLSIL